jgi:hypothetical protein
MARAQRFALMSRRSYRGSTLEHRADLDLFLVDERERDACGGRLRQRRADLDRERQRFAAFEVVIVCTPFVALILSEIFGLILPPLVWPIVPPWRLTGVPPQVKDASSSPDAGTIAMPSVSFAGSPAAFTTPRRPSSASERTSPAAAPADWQAPSPSRAQPVNATLRSPSFVLAVYAPAPDTPAHTSACLAAVAIFKACPVTANPGFEWRDAADGLGPFIRPFAARDRTAGVREFVGTAALQAATELRLIEGPSALRSRPGPCRPRWAGPGKERAEPLTLRPR